MFRQLPDSLKSTVRLVNDAFPEGIPDELYFPVVRVLNEEMSDRNLAMVISYIRGTDESIALNHVYQAAQLSLDDDSIEKALALLNAHGYADWAESEL